jgi:hypothetical protein
MSTQAIDLARTVKLMRPVLPAKNFDISKQFYADLGFQSRMLSDGLVEMHLGPCTFILQNYYVQQWADNFVVHMGVSDLNTWWNHIMALDLPTRYGVKTDAPRRQDWGLVAGVVDPSGVLWRIAEIPALGQTEALPNPRPDRQA